MLGDVNSGARKFPEFIILSPKNLKVACDYRESHIFPRLILDSN